MDLREHQKKAIENIMKKDSITLSMPITKKDNEQLKKQNKSKDRSAR